jgi:hypothetical protein
MGSGILSPRVKWQAREPDHLTATSAEVKKTSIYKSTIPYVFIVNSICSKWEHPIKMHN